MFGPNKHIFFGKKTKVSQIYSALRADITSKYTEFPTDLFSFSFIFQLYNLFVFFGGF